MLIVLNWYGKLVEEYQSAFIKGRYIQNHIRLILDMIDYQSLIQSESLILFIDFFKAFDTVEHEFIFTTLRMFGFGEGFCKVIKMFYNNIYSYISLNKIVQSLQNCLYYALKC